MIILCGRKPSDFNIYMSELILSTLGKWPENCKWIIRLKDGSLYGTVERPPCDFIASFDGQCHGTAKLTDPRPGDMVARDMVVLSKRVFDYLSDNKYLSDTFELSMI